MAMAQSAHEMRSPVDSSMSISRRSGSGETSWAIAISSSVVFPRAESTATTRRPDSRWATIRLAAALIRSASATLVPPNFITIVSGVVVALIGQSGYALRARPPRSGPSRPDQPDPGHRVRIVGDDRVVRRRQRLDDGGMRIGAGGEPPVPLDHDRPRLQAGPARVAQQRPLTALDVDLEQVDRVIEREQVDRRHRD